MVMLDCFNLLVHEVDGLIYLLDCLGFVLFRTHLVDCRLDLLFRGRGLKVGMMRCWAGVRMMGARRLIILFQHGYLELAFSDLLLEVAGAALRFR